MAEFRVAAVFSNNCVLQRDKNVTIFGEGEDGKCVTVSILGNTYTGVVKGERFEVEIPPMKAQTGLTFTVSCGEDSKTFYNVAVGEVWLAGGQSNMEFELHNMKGGMEHLKNDHPNVRFYYTNKIANMDEKFFAAERNSGWGEFSEQGAQAWSAVGYLFAKKLSEDLGVTVGVIGCNWGGTSSSAWMRRGALEEDAELRSYVDEYESAIAGKSVEEQIREYAEYEEYDRKWNEEANKVYAVEPNIDWNELQKKIGPNKWPGPMCCVNPFRPSGLYKCMLQRVMPYTLRGFLYYQGESDDHKPNMYFKLFSKLIQEWRNDWNDDELPFLFVQLPMHKYAADPDYKHWCLIREAQDRVFRTVKNTGMAVIIDAGEFNEIHPKDKEPVGYRLELQAMNTVYGKLSEDEANGPIYDHYVVDGDKMEIYFKHAAGGFKLKGEMSGFEIAGSDKQFVEAKATICGDAIILTSPLVAKPVYARYLWTNYGEVTLYGANDIPVAPFRTSRDDTATEVKSEVKIQQVMEL